MNKILINIATLFGIGKIPKAPGTFGTLATIPLVFVLSKLGPFGYMAAIFLLLPVAIIACTAYEQHSGTHDNKEIVIDEVLGFLITMVWLPLTWQAIVIGFAVFRLLDITKPLFIGYLDKKVQGGLGVVIDDVVAGLVASVVMQVIYTQTNWLGVQMMVIK